MFELHPERPLTTRDRRAPVAVDPARVLSAALPRRWWILGLAAALTIACWVAIRLFVPQDFRADTMIAWVAAPDAVAEDAARQFRGLADSIKLPSTLTEVRRRLNLKTTLPALGARLDVSASEGSNVVRIEAAADDPALAARIADTVVDVFLEETLDRDRRQATARERELQAQIAAARAHLGAATGAYEEFRKSSGISDLPTERQVAIEQVAKLQSESELARADAESGRRKIGASAEGTSATPPADAKLLPYVAKLAEVNADLAAAKSAMSSDHPRVQSLEAGAVAMRRLVDKQQAVIAAEERERLLRKRDIYARLAQEARDRVAALTSVEARASDLLGAIHVGERLVAEAEAERIKAVSAMSDPGSPFRIVARASIPERPLRSLRRPLALLAPLLSLVLAVGLIVGTRLRGLRPRTAREVAYWGRAPVLTGSTWPAEPEAREALAVELRRLVPPTGTTLIVAAEVDALPAAAELAELLGHGAKVHARAALDGLDGVRDLRRSCRDATRVLVLVSAGRLTHLRLRGLGRPPGTQRRRGLRARQHGPDSRRPGGLRRGSDQLPRLKTHLRREPEWRTSIWQSLNDGCNRR